MPYLLLEICIPASYLVIYIFFFDASEAVSRVLQEAFKKVSRMIQEKLFLSTN